MAREADDDMDEEGAVVLDGLVFFRCCFWRGLEKKEGKGEEGGW